MSASYVRICCDRGEIRKFGGNRSAVRSMIHYYKGMTLGEFMFKHPYLTANDYKTLRYEYVKKS